MSTQSEIKFRAWDNEAKNMVRSGGLYMSLHRCDVLEYWGNEPYSEYTDKYVLMQYTGLKDKNGKEIYEGDILSEWGMDKEHYRYAVEDMVDFLISYGDSDHWDGGSFPGIWEVIGNIYENPELLTGKP